MSRGVAGKGWPLPEAQVSFLLGTPRTLAVSGTDMWGLLVCGRGDQAPWSLATQTSDQEAGLLHSPGVEAPGPRL